MPIAHSDTDLANAVRTAAEALNRATRTAIRAGMTVEITVAEKPALIPTGTPLVTTRIMRDL